ncbi:MAG: mercuric transporter MerT family protein [Calditrichia bacterium]|nr:hypothetical protein [Calditrichota bacterium]MCB0266651.1 hypothetical protein [Calditrichota bacterium]MCB9067224.1 hypothetical protein [Calditrichia bacterium]
MKAIWNREKAGKWGIFGVIVGAIGASICCIGPLVLLALGIGGSWAGNLAAFETYRPIFMGITFVFLGFAYYQVYKKPKTEECCDTDGQCATPQRKKFMKTTLWIVTVLSLGLVAFPYLAPSLTAAVQNAPPPSISPQKVVLTVHSMTCGGCALTVQQSLVKVDGVCN